ncbi:hypothetical protein [Adlercreutzia sp. ZJ242]|uniref:hypothetical protein n=1 Tax=Adlercreutzia sp. ZJ242 TaxID=2709409 RepID=UPI0013EB8671|nr:hypothetical protein [Adlercreutzia sp. ZJ242]
MRVNLFIKDRTSIAALPLVMAFVLALLFLGGCADQVAEESSSNVEESLSIDSSWGYIEPHPSLLIVNATDSPWII